MKPTTATSSRQQHAFTILEMVLAISLASIVVIFALGIFTTIDRAHKFQGQRMDRAQELATAYRTLSKSFTQLLMTDAALPPGDDMKKKIEKDVAEATAEGAAYIRDANAGDSRVSLQPVAGATWPFGGPVQTLELTLRSAPILGGLEEVSGSEDELAIAETYASAARAGGNREAATTYDTPTNSRASAGRAAGSGSGSSSKTKGGPSSKFVKALKTSGTAGPLVDNVLASTSTDDSDDNAEPEPARAPGLRGVYEVRNEAQVTGRGGVIDPADVQGEPVYALWWRELPSAGSTSSTRSTANFEIRNADARLEAESRLSNTEGRQIKLIGGLKKASWRAFRQRSFVEKMAVKYDRELPAYVEFSFETIDGRNEKWLFEVAWSKGPEPGTIVQANTDPLLGSNGVPVANQDGGTVDPVTGEKKNDGVNKANEDQFAKLEALLGKEKTDEIRRKAQGAGGGGTTPK